MTDKGLLTKKEAAAYLSVGDTTLHRLMVTGELPHVRRGARWVRFRREDLDRWVAAHRVGGDD